MIHVGYRCRSCRICGIVTLVDRKEPPVGFVLPIRHRQLARIRPPWTVECEGICDVVSMDEVDGEFAQAWASLGFV